jgi:hypothetical protein
MSPRHPSYIHHQRLQTNKRADPDDACHIILALCMSSQCPPHPETTKKGPNTLFRHVWALSVHFYLFLLFNILMKVFRNLQPLPSCHITCLPRHHQLPSSPGKVHEQQQQQQQQHNHNHNHQDCSNGSSSSSSKSTTTIDPTTDGSNGSNNGSSSK